MIYLFRAPFSKDSDPWDLGLIQVGEMRLFQQQRKAPLLQAFHSTALMHLFDPLHSIRASPTASGEPFAVPPGSATMRVSGAAAAQRGVLEMQILGGLWAQPKPCGSSAEQMHPSLQEMLSYSPAFALLQYTEGRRVQRGLCEQEGPSWSSKALGESGPGAMSPVTITVLLI